MGIIADTFKKRLQELQDRDAEDQRVLNEMLDQLQNLEHILSQVVWVEDEME